LITVALVITGVVAFEIFGGKDEDSKEDKKEDPKTPVETN
tara:strand:+ start:394 stop:513 length:120 start_codon:yes stop_codon:yes gene_type:complete